MWESGQAWRTVESLNKLRKQIQEACPRAVPPATPAVSWGTIADNRHNTTSDHYPHYYSVLGKIAVVCAHDIPHAPKLGLNAHAIAEALRKSRDPRIRYIISNGRITGPNYDWQWSEYNGSDPHDTHIHVSVVHTAIADSTRNWSIGIEEDDVGLTAEETQEAVKQGVAELLEEMTDDRATSQRGRLAAQRIERMIVNPIVKALPSDAELASALENVVLLIVEDDENPITLDEEQIRILSDQLARILPTSGTFNLVLSNDTNGEEQ